jgi:uncharacterized membrane protein YbhN (UPF0104 family)
VAAETQHSLEEERLELDEAKASRNLRHGLIALVILVAMVVGLVLAVPGLHDVGQQVLHMPIGFVILAVMLEVFSCLGYVVSFLQVFDRAPIRFGARVALSELAFGAAVSLGGAGSIAVGAWLLIERGARPGRVAERSAVLFLLTSGINLITLALAGLGVWFGIIPGDQNPLLSLVPGLVGVGAFLGFLALPKLTDMIVGNRPCGRIGTWSRATSETIRATAYLLFHPEWRLLGAFAYLWFDIAVLWVCFRALGPVPPISTVVLAYQIGYLSNLIPIPGGIGVLDGSFVGMFVLYGVNDTLATSATLVYHAISLWVPATWGTIAFVLLRRSRNQPIKWRLPRSERIQRRRERRKSSA